MNEDLDMYARDAAEILSQPDAGGQGNGLAEPDAIGGVGCVRETPRKNLACTMAPGRGDTDLVLLRLAADLAERGLRCCGTIQINSERADSGPCDMDVKVLPDGPVLRISQNLGPSARGCRLDPDALETAVSLVSASLADGADVLIVNKFGRQEADGHGFRPVIAEALALGIPVTVGVNALNLPAFVAFAGGLAIRLPPDAGVLGEWVVGARLPSNPGLPRDFGTGLGPPHLPVRICPSVSARPPVREACP